MTTTNTTTSEKTIAELTAKRAAALELKSVERALKEAQELAKWEAEVTAVNPGYVAGSVRKATAEDESVLGHTHGRVCEIECQECGERRIVNLQDARQCRLCRSCKKVADKAKTKLNKMSKRLADKSVQDIEREIAEKMAQLEAMTAAKVA